VRQATLIFNPRAGRRRDLAQLMPTLIRTLGHHGVHAVALETPGPAIAGILAARAAASGSNLVFACGGDGTVHEVLQGLVGTTSTLGIVPIGTANALARNLRISRDPIRAVVQQADAASVRIAVGQVSYASSPGNVQSTPARRYFTVMAGAGPDGALVYSLLTAQKSAIGRAAYYAHAARLFVTRTFPSFRVSYRLQGSEIWQDDTAVSVMAARIDDLGGIFSRLTPGCSLHAGTLRLFLVRPPATLALPAWFAFGQLGMHHANPWLRTLDVEQFRCMPSHHGVVTHAQVDGEWIGTLPFEVCLVPDALSIVVALESNHSKPPASR
jgi:diacylglycerol kinase family enzyme